MTAELSHLELAEGKDPIEESLKLSIAGGEPAQASWVDVVNKVIFDQLTGKKPRSEFPAVIRGMVDYEKASWAIICGLIVCYEWTLLIQKQNEISYPMN